MCLNARARQRERETDRQTDRQRDRQTERQRQAETDRDRETMCKSFVLPLFDYADIVWDNCTNTQSKMLENLHLETIRIMIRGIRGTSHQKLYKESGFCTLKERRKRHKLLTFHKMILGLCLQYISDLLPPLVAHIKPYHRRRPSERDVTACKTELYHSIYNSRVEFSPHQRSTKYIFKCF